MNGWIRIGIGMDDHKFNAQYKELKNKIDEAEIYAQHLNEKMEDTRTALQTIADEIDKAKKGLLDEETILKRIQNIAETFDLDFSNEYEELLKTMSPNEAYQEIIKIFESGVKDELREQYEEYKKVNGQIDVNREKLKALTQEHHKVSKAGTQAFKKLTSGAKRLVLGLVGVASVYGVLHKAVSSYMSSDDKMNKQMQMNWVALGTILAPAIKLITDLFKKAVTSILYFMYLLTGIDYIAEANAKALKQQTNATNQLTKANDKFTASFDELNKVQESSSTNSLNDDLGIDSSMLYNINDLSESTRQAIEKIAKALEPVIKNVKNLIDWGKENPDIVIGILGGLALVGLLNKIMGVTGVSGLLGINGILLGLAEIGIISIGINLYTIGKSVQELQDLLDRLDEKNAKDTRSVQEEQDDIQKNIKSYKKNSKEVQELTQKLNKKIDAEHNHQKSLFETISSMSTTEIIAAKLSGEWEHMTNEITESIQKEWAYLETSKKLYEQGKLNDEQTYEYMQRLSLFNTQLEGVNSSIEKGGKVFSFSTDQMKVLSNITTKTGNAMIDAKLKTNMFTEVIEKQDKAIDNLAESMNSVPKYLQSEIDVDIESAQEKVDTIMEYINHITNTPKTIKIKSNTSEVENAVDNIMATLNHITGRTYSVKITYNLAQSVVNERDKAVAYIKEILGIPMATGGIHIVNNPGKGVISGGAITGEVSREGVIPLTNESAMRELGENIGRFVTINATLINEINGRILSKEVKEIMSQSDFASNI